MPARRLNQDLVDRLAKRHREGRDFRTQTALLEDVHPDLLQDWLEKGSRDVEGKSVESDLFRKFSKVEGEIRAEWIGEIANTIVATEETEFDGEGKALKKTRTTRSVSGVQWLLSKRFPQWRDGYTMKPTEKPAEDFLQRQPGQGLTLEAAIAICEMIAASMPPQLAPVFAAHGWVRLPAGAEPEKGPDDGEDGSSEDDDAD